MFRRHHCVDRPQPGYVQKSVAGSVHGRVPVQIMAAKYKDIRFDIVDRVARVTFARPPLNVLTISMTNEITDAVNRVVPMQEVCAIVFSAQASSHTFSAGVSVEEHRVETAYQMLEGFHGVFRALNTACKPVVALVSGAALGGGCELVAFADIVIATRSSRFGQPEIKLGVFPPVASVILPRVIGEKKARQMILTGELLTADAAQTIGLVNHVVDDDQLGKKADEVLGQLRQLSAPALEMTRRAMTQAWGTPFEEALKRVEDIYLNKLMTLKDPHEGIEAFIAKRAPKWKHK